MRIHDLLSLELLNDENTSADFLTTDQTDRQP